MFEKFCYLLSIITLFIFVSFSLIFKVPELPQQLLLSQEVLLDQQVLPDQEILPDQEQPLEQRCYQNELTKSIDSDGIINLLVWNIYKQSRNNWQTALDHFSKNTHLILLQEVSLTKEFKKWLKKKHWGSNYVSAFSAFDTRSGVLNLATQLPLKACAYIAMEPWLRLPKSGLYALYQLSNGQQLAVINIHAINITLGTEEYEQQVAALKTAIDSHSGPVIMAGDFNTWSEQRTTKLKEILLELQLKEVSFESDNRMQFINGLPLDHVFYKGLHLNDAKVPATTASDHNPLIVQFKIP